MLHTNCHALHFTLPSDAKIQKNAVQRSLKLLYIKRWVGGVNGGDLPPPPLEIGFLSWKAVDIEPISPVTTNRRISCIDSLEDCMTALQRVRTAGNNCSSGHVLLEGLLSHWKDHPLEENTIMIDACKRWSNIQAGFGI